jgi:hypothetical protein
VLGRDVGPTISSGLNCKLPEKGVLIAAVGVEILDVGDDLANRNRTRHPGHVWAHLVTELLRVISS